MALQILRRPHVETATGLGRSAIYEKLNPKSAYYDPHFPKPVRLGKRAVGWRNDEIDAWLESRSASAAR